MHACFVDAGNKDYKAPWHQLCNIPRVFTSEDTTIQTPNSDTPYSRIGLDLCSQPLVFTVPKTEKDCYVSLQLIDFFTFNFDCPGSRTSGIDGGNFPVVGPGWNGDVPAGIAKKPWRCG